MVEFSAFPERLETERLWLRRWEPADAEVYRGLWLERDSRALRRIGADGRPTLDEMRGWLIENPRAAVEGLGLLPIVRRREGDVIGYCGLTVGQASFEEPEIAYELAKRAHGFGYATEAAQAVLEAAVATGRKRLWATVREWNAPSFRVLEKLGFYNSGRVDENPHRGNSIWMTYECPRGLRKD
ncbi:GNAT family N-acetyltransferase [Kribbella sp. NPDC050470]|uniref:GNAT family N-acetyltransferase n=1 Tax=unclassified Kribbella TaxID=2644121 RepID=UPI0037A7B6D4